MYYISNQIIKSEIDDDYLLIKNDINLIFDGQSEIIHVTYKKPICEDSKGVPWTSQTSKSYSSITSIPCRINAKWEKGVHVPKMTSISFDVYDPSNPDRISWPSYYSGCKSGCGDNFSSRFVYNYMNFEERDKIKRVWNCKQGAVDIYTLIKANNDQFNLITQTSDDISFNKYNSKINNDYILYIHETLFSFYKEKDSYVPNKFRDIYRFIDEDIETKFHKVKRNEGSRSGKPHHSQWVNINDYYESKIYLDYMQESYSIVTKDDDITQAIWSKFYLFTAVLVFLYTIFSVFLFYRNK